MRPLSLYPAMMSLEPLFHRKSCSSLVLLLLLGITVVTAIAIAVLAASYIIDTIDIIGAIAIATATVTAAIAAAIATAIAAAIAAAIIGAHGGPVAPRGRSSDEHHGVGQEPCPT